MIKAIASSLVLFASLLNTSVAATPEEMTMKNEQNTIIESINSMTNAFHTSDINGVLASYEKGAAVMFEPAQQISDPAVIKQMFEGAFQINPKFDYAGHDVYIANDCQIFMRALL